MKIGVALLIPALVAPLAVGSATSRTTFARASDVAHLYGPFQARLYQGPDKGLTLAGTLRLRVPQTGGSAVGTLTRSNHTVIPVTGQIQGYAVNLFFLIGGGRYMVGVGTAGYVPSQKQWVAAGTLAGPRRGDIGDWDHAIKSGYDLKLQKPV